MGIPDNMELICLYRIDENLLKQLYLITISRILQQMIASSPEALDYNNLTVFDSYDIPPISISDYLVRIMSYSRASSRNMVMGLSFIDKLSNDEDCPVNLTRHNVHRLLWVSIMVAAKFYEDFYLDNDSWGRIAGLTLQEINRLERKFLAYINFDINTKIDWFMNYVQLLLSYAVENNIVDAEIAQGILKSIVDATVIEVKDSEID